MSAAVLSFPPSCELKQKARGGGVREEGGGRGMDLISEKYKWNDEKKL